MRQICKQEERRRIAARKKPRAPARPIDIDAAEGARQRDVWLTYLPSPDPRFDNMVPVE